VISFSFRVIWFVTKKTKKPKTGTYMEKFIMSRKELEQITVFEEYKKGEITQGTAAYRLGVTIRWVRKKVKRYLAEGAAGLMHKSRGKPSEKCWDKAQEAFTINLLKTEWHDFGPTLTAEKLFDIYRIKVSKETIRKAMIRAGIHQEKTKRRKHRKRRQRYVMLGLMAQCDGSPHDWFEGRGEWCTLLVFIDDATSKILWLEFAKSESTDSLMRATKNYIQKYGRPKCFYVDHGGSFHVNLNNKEHTKLTQWGRAMAELGIEVIYANSPQAKGRVERSNKTFQDRLVKEMRLVNVSSIEEANRFLRESDFIERHNRKFAVEPAQKGDAHRAIIAYDLDTIFCTKETRKVANDFTIQYEKRIFQLHDQQQVLIREKDEIVVRIHLNRSITLSIRGIPLNFSEIETRPEKPMVEKTCASYKPHKTSEAAKRFGSGLPSMKWEIKHPPVERRVG